MIVEISAFASDSTASTPTDGFGKNKRTYTRLAKWHNLICCISHTSLSKRQSDIFQHQYSTIIIPPMILGQQPLQRKRLCRHSGCKKVRQTKGLCKLHGGGSRCTASGCTKTNQGGGFCRRHGGGKACSVEGCGKGAQRRGLCYRHGGKRYCTIEGCDKKDRGSGLCAAHGGGKQCKADGCENLSRNVGFCYQHYNQSLKIPYQATFEVKIDTPRTHQFNVRNGHQSTRLPSLKARVRELEDRPLRCSILHSRTREMTSQSPGFSSNETNESTFRQAKSIADLDFKIQTSLRSRGY